MSKYVYIPKPAMGSDPIKRRFLPLFCTQFLGAFNDSVLKNALIILFAFSTTKTILNPNTLVNLCAALFIAPFFLFSGLAGELADKFEKSKLIRWIKLIEVILAALATLGFYLEHTVLLLTALFLLGTQATFFGPVKYSIIPQLLPPSKLVAGNGLMGMGTFIAILLGTILGGFLVSIPNTGLIWVSVSICVTALMGLLCSFFIPSAKAYIPKLKVKFSPTQQIVEIRQAVSQNRILLPVIIGISWFWSYGSIFLTQTGTYTRLVLNSNERVASLILTVFSVGIGLGSLMCGKLVKKFEMGLVPLGAFGLTLFAIDFAFANSPFPENILNVMAFLNYGQNWRILTDGFLMGTFGGFFVVPLYTLLQNRSLPEQRSRVIAANNILNAILMTISALISIVLLNIGVSIPYLFLLTAILNAAVAVYIFKSEPDFLKNKPLVK